MRIIILPSPEGNVIAREDQLGRLEAKFVVDANGVVFYEHPWDEHRWFAGDNKTVFQLTAEAWNYYCDEGQMCQDEIQSEEVLEKLRTELLRLGVLKWQPNNLWISLLEQATHGM